MQEQTKVCRKCGIEKPVSEFGRDARNADMLNSYCRDCRKAINRAKHGGMPHMFSRFTDAEIDAEVARRLACGASFPEIAKHFQSEDKA